MKNEEAFLDACLASIVDVVDEIVVVDTGSTDSSVAIAQRHGARVLQFVWSNSFADARNHGLDAIDNGWILYVDADERLTAPATRDAMHAALAVAESTHVAALKLHFTLIQGQTHGYEWRMWKHHPEIRFEGVIHESIAPSIHRVLERDHLHHQDSDDIRLSHFGYEGNQRAKDERNLPMLLEEIERTPHRPYLYDHLARVLERLDRHDEARTTWERGMSVARDLGSRRQLIDSLCHADMVMRAIDRAGTPSALDYAVIDEAFALFPENWVIRWAVGLRALGDRDFERGAAIAQEIIGATDDEVHRHGITYPLRLFGDWSHHLLGMCRFEQGRFAEAADAFARAAELAPDAAAYVVKRDLARAKAERA